MSAPNASATVLRHWRPRVIAVVCTAFFLTLAIVGSRLVAGSPRVKSQSPTTVSYRTLQWDELIPASWNPVQHFMDRNRANVDDGTLEGERLRQEMRTTWDNAPTLDTLDGAAVRLPGYVVPLDEVDGQLKEFLLVPYFGACIHSPPPPANQIVLVASTLAVKGLHAMDPVWVSGRLSTERRESSMGISGYRLSATVIERYTPARP